MSSLQDRIKAKRQAIADKGNKFKRAFKWPNGKTAFRILPGVKDPDDFYVDMGKHWIKNPVSGELITSIGCRTICFGEPDPVKSALQELQRKAAQAGDEELQKTYKDMEAKNRPNMNGLILNAKGVEFDPNEPELLEFSEAQFDKLLSLLEDLTDDMEDGEQGPFSLEAGAIFILEKSGSGMETKYNIYPHPKGQKHKADPSVMDRATDLESFRRGQFDESANTALAALSTYLGRDLTEGETKMLTGAPASSDRQIENSAASDDDDVLDIDAEELDTSAEENEAKTSTEEVEVDDDFMAGLDDI